MRMRVVAAAAAPVAGTPEVAPRPRDVRIDGVDPCSLLEAYRDMLQHVP